MVFCFFFFFSPSQAVLALERQLLEDLDSDEPYSLDEYAAQLEKVLQVRMALNPKLRYVYITKSKGQGAFT